MTGTHSIGHKLRRLSVLSSAAALLAASLALLFFQLRDVRASLLRRYGTVADLIAFNSEASVDFNDPDAADKMLASLKTTPAVMSAGIMVGDRLFASYQRDSNVRPLPRRSVANAYTLAPNDVTIFRPITNARGGRLGTLFVQTDLRELNQTWLRFAMITGIVAIPALLIAIAVCYPLQRTISLPILNLAELAERVSTTKDYSVRASVGPSAAEVDQLVSTFNEMLGQIELQHAEIEDARATLERRVADRTAELALRAEQLEEKRRELASANQELEAFSYSVSHDLRAPLRAIDGFSKAVMTDYESKQLDERGMHYLERVRAGTQKMSQLIDAMLQLARITRRNLDREDVDVSEIARQVFADTAKLYSKRQIACDVEPGMHAWADPHLLSIVFMNFIGNACKFTANKPDARITVGRESAADGGSAFFVRDNGAGFQMAYANKLFSPFQRLHTESEFEGTGIGLATVKRIIGRHGGTVWAEAAPGQGATFHFTLGGPS